jgi:hypothetical protein
MNADQTAPLPMRADEVEVPASGREGDGDVAPTREPYVHHLVLNSFESDVVDLYAVGHEKRRNDDGEEAQPFIHNVKLLGPQGEVVRVWGMFDDGAMVAAMCSRVFARVKHRLGDC